MSQFEQEKQPGMNVFIIGFGDIGCRVARLCRQQGYDVGAISRQPGKCSQEVTAVTADLDDPDSLRDLPLQEKVLFYFAPPPVSGCSDSRMTNLVAALNRQPDQQPKKVVLISTTAVYGDCGGQWIDETAIVQPQTARGQRRLDAEQQMLRWTQQYAIPLVILRVGGIYGPKRLPLDRLRQGLPILLESQSPYTNRIHEDDLAAICLAAAQQNVSGYFNVSDGHPGTMSRYFKDIARAMDLAPPPEVNMDTAREVMSAGMLSYLQESRRLNNTKLLQELDIELRYPNFEQGLKACVAELATQWDKS
ncbi:MAG: SDR family oxidoreductase [Gammaproteobacteria bacterium]|nr:SDR family oxidoreductase [Gammaproteobacteria bacterium]MDH5799561.1 SDR family oxidoreductase [Gammaproteobacteria bacterium]